MTKVTPSGPWVVDEYPTFVLHQSPTGADAKFSSIALVGRGSPVPMYPAKALMFSTAQLGSPSSAPGTWIFGSTTAPTVQSTALVTHLAMDIAMTAMLVASVTSR